MDISFWLLVGVGVMLALSAAPTVIGWIKAKWPTAIPATITEVAAEVSAYQEQAATWAALVAAEAMLRKKGDVANADVILKIIPTVKPWGWIAEVPKA